MLADFVIPLEYPDTRPNRSVRVCVHNNLRDMHSAATKHSRIGLSKGRKEPSTPKEVWGVCHRFETYSDHTQVVSDPLCAIVRLAPPHIGIGIVSHELAHAAVWIRELQEGEQKPLTCENDEEFCWILGELVRRTVNKMHDYELYS